MNTLSAPIVIEAINTLMTEAYAGPPDPTSTWFIDNEPDSGIFGVLAHLTAAEASRSVDGSGQPGTTIASNVEHMRWSLANANAALRGETYQGKWRESWNLLTTEDDKWDQLRQALRTEFAVLQEEIKKQQDLPGDFLLGVLALIPHAAFHLGILRQMIERVRS
jgi:hypothetical protein